MLIFPAVLAFFVSLLFIWSLGEQMYLKKWKITLTIFLALFVGAPIGGVVTLFLGSILEILNILEGSLEASLTFLLFVVPWGLLVGAIATVGICFRYFKKAQESEHNQYDKLKNDEKAKRF